MKRRAASKARALSRLRASDPEIAAALDRIERKSQAEAGRDSMYALSAHVAEQAHAKHSAIIKAQAIGTDDKKARASEQREQWRRIARELRADPLKKKSWTLDDIAEHIIERCPDAARKRSGKLHSKRTIKDALAGL
ncbi:MAG: hypothetical protein ABI423_02030 [Burkholderiales bacterium]